MHFVFSSKKYMISFLPLLFLFGVDAEEGVCHTESSGVMIAILNAGTRANLEKIVIDLQILSCKGTGGFPNEDKEMFWK